MTSASLQSFQDTLHVRDHCLCLHAQRAARSLARLFDAVLRPLRLSSGQFSLLNALNRPEPARPAEVARLLGMDRTTLTAALKPLTRRGLAEVQVDPGDRRVRRLVLTPAGCVLLAEAVPLWRSTHEWLEKRFPPGEPERLRAGLKALG